MTRLRSYIFLTFLFVVTLVAAFFLSPSLLISEKAARACITLWAKTILGALQLICGISYTIEGAENMIDGGAIVAANHQSMWETIALYLLLPRPVMVFKKELARNPVYRMWAKYAGIAVDRDAGVKAIQALTKAAEMHIKHGRQVILFPEGTRVTPGERQPFQPGVAAIYKKIGVRCLPIAHNSGCHWQHPGPLKVPGKITVKILPEIAPGMKRKEFTQKLENVICDARPDLQPQKDHSFGSQAHEALSQA